MADMEGSLSAERPEDLFKLWYELLRLARSDGLLALEKHVTSPHESVIFGKYPSLATNHHVMEFICSALTPVIERSVPGERIPLLLDAELKAMEEEHHAPLGVLSKTADALPGFGIVAAVMGIVITMGAIDGPVEEIGHKVGAALVGTFLGILLSYGFFAPLAVRMEFQSAEEMAFFHTIKAIVQGVIDGWQVSHRSQPRTCAEFSLPGRLGGSVKRSKRLGGSDGRQRRWCMESGLGFVTAMMAFFGHVDRGPEQELKTAVAETSGSGRPESGGMSPIPMRNHTVPSTMKRSSAGAAA